MPTIEEAFPDPTSVLGSRPLHEYFQKGFKQGFGDRPFGLRENDVKALRDSGLFGDVEKKHQNVLQQFNETLILGTPAAIDFGIRSIMGLAYGVSQAAVETGIPRDLTPGAWLDAFPAGRGTAFPARIHPVKPPVDLDAALELGLLGRDASIVARERFAPDPIVETTVRSTEERPAALVEEQAVQRQPVEQPPDLHTLARQIAPDTFQQYDELVSRKETFRRWIDEISEQRAEAPRVKELQRTIDNILGKVNGVEERLTNRAARRLEAAREELDTITRNDTPDMARVRKEMQETDFKMRDLSPQVSEAYREARRLVPEEAPFAQPEPPRTAEIVVFPEQAPSEVRVEPAIRTLAQRAVSIARDTEQHLVAAGRPAVEARLAGALIQAHYEARAARFNGVLGSARDLYEREAPRIVGASGAQRGRTILREQHNTIQLFERADSSTFIHETAHNWLEELRRDVVHPAATTELKADMDVVKTWLGVEGDTFTKASHEKFARGFERYLMEGQAPTSRLARVFEKFKEWLTQIYQSVARLRAPINDDIRGVYDRLLSTPTKEPVIIPERQGAVSFAEEHRVAARETPIADAAAKADEMATQREQVARFLKEELDARRREARSGPQRVNVVREGESRGISDAARADDAAADAGFREGRTPPKGETPTPQRGGDRFEDGDSTFVDKAGNIRIENLMVPDDVAAAIREAAGRESGFLDARRGVLADADAIRLAEDLGVDPAKLDRWAVAEAWTAEEILFARKALVQSATKVRDAARRAANGTEADVVEYALARERHIMIQERVSAVTAEAGRALRAFRQLDGITDIRELEQFFNQTLNKTPAELRREARLVSAATTPQNVSATIQRLNKPSWADKLAEAWINTLLSGPYTHVVNMATNAGVALWSIPETAGAAAVSRITGSQAVAFAEVGDRIAGLLQGSVDGIKAAGAVILDEGKIPQARTVDTRHMQAIPSVTVNVGGVPIKLGGATIRLPGRFLAAEDEFFKAIAFQQELNVLARRAARQEGLTGDAAAARINQLLANPTDSMIAVAEKFAEYQTFTNMLGSAGRAIQSFANAHPTARFVLPFVRTPINLFKYSAERSPIGFAFKEVRDNISGKNGTVARDTQIARMALGNMVALGVGWLAYQGLISGGGPKEQEAQETLRNTGWQPYSARIGDTWYSYRRFDPFSNVIGLAADAADLSKYVLTNDDEYEKLTSMTVLAVWRNLFDKLSMRGITSLVQAVTDPDRYGDTYINGFVGSFVPAAVSQVARMDDPVMREARSVADAIRSRIPGYRQELFPRRDRWGEPISETEIGPILTRAVNSDPVNLALRELEINKDRPQRKINDVELTDKQYDDYARTSGRIAKIMLDQIVTPQFRQLPRGMQVKIINNTIDTAREYGRSMVLKEALGSENDLVAKGIELQLKQLR